MYLTEDNRVKNINTTIPVMGFVDIENINEDLIGNYLYTKNMPDPDLMIRTSGELRTSNFLPWQSTYSEGYFPKKLWPAFTKKDMIKALIAFTKRT